MARDQQKGAEDDRLAGAQIAVGQEPAHERHQINQRGVGGVLALAEAVREQELLGQIEDQKPAHAVVGEALPHLGEEQHAKAGRVAAQLRQHRYPRQHRDEDADHHNHVEHSAPPALGGWNMTMRPPFHKQAR